MKAHQKCICSKGTGEQGGISECDVPKTRWTDWKFSTRWSRLNRVVTSPSLHVLAVILPNL